MKTKAHLLLGAAMTAAERATGRYMRAPDGHGDPAPAPAEATPEPTPTPAPAEEAKDDFGTEDDFTKFEARARGEKPEEPAPKEEKPEEAEEGASEEESGEEEGVEEKPEDKPEDKPEELTAEQKRIKELEERIAENERERERARDEEMRRLREENEKLRKKPEEGEPGEWDGQSEPNPDDYEYGDADSQFIADKAEWRAEQRIQAREQERQLREGFTELENNWKSQIESPEVKERYPDFEEKVIKSAERGDWKLSLEGSLLVRSSPVAADVAHHLASDPAESRRIAGLSVVEQAQEIGRIEGRYLNAQKGTAPEEESARETPKAPPKAPPPPKKTVRGAGGRFDIDPATDDFSAFEAKSRKVLEEQNR